MPGLQYLGLYAPPPNVPQTSEFPLVIVTTELPAIASGQPYTTTIEATGGQPPYVFGIVDGVLPPGLAITGAGVITGTPTMPSVTFSPPVLALAMVDTAYHEHVTVSEGEHSYPFTVRVIDQYNQRDDQSYTLTIFDVQALGAVTFTADGCVPPCLGVGADGSIGGIPMKVGHYSITMVATDSGGRALHQTYSLIVRPKP